MRTGGSRTQHSSFQGHWAPDPAYPALGATSVAPTLIWTDQTSANVVPGECQLTLDFRNSPKDSPEVILGRVRELLGSALEDGATGTVLRAYLTLRYAVGAAAQRSGG